jgi:small-conductance mechanosensitive channel
VIFALATPIVLSHYAYTNKLSSIFEFKTIFKILKKTWLDILIFNIVLYIAIMILEVVISVIAFLCTMTIILIPVAIWIAGMFLYYIYTVMGYAYGRIYLKGITE